MSSVVVRSVETRLLELLGVTKRQVKRMAPTLRLRVSRHQFNFSPQSKGFELALTGRRSRGRHNLLILSISLCHVESDPLINVMLGASCVSDALNHSFPDSQRCPDGWIKVNDDVLAEVTGTVKMLCARLQTLGRHTLISLRYPKLD